MRWSRSTASSFFQVLDAARAAYGVSATSILAIMQLSTTNLRTVMGSMDLDETLSKRDEINYEAAPGGRSGHRGLGREDHPVELKDIRPPADIVNAMAPPDEGRAREARDHPLVRGARGSPRSTVPRASKQAQILRGWRAAARRRSGDAEGTRALGSGRAAATEAGLGCDRRRRRTGDQLFHRAEICRGDRHSSPPRPTARPSCSRSRRLQLMGTLGGIGELARVKRSAVTAIPFVSAPRPPARPRGPFEGGQQGAFPRLCMEPRRALALPQRWCWRSRN